MGKGRDIDIPGYPLPCDPISGMGWWRFNAHACLAIGGWREWQGNRRMDAVIPVLRWAVYGAIPEKIDG